jgi:hypothetical protein
MKRIYHRYENWEDWPAGFYNSSGRNKAELIEKVVELFSSKTLTREFMDKAIEAWPNSMEHNLTNPAMNRIAYLGQAACCIYAGVPSIVTMEAWSKVPEKHRKEADEIAKELINNWETNTIQICLKFH